MNVVLRTRQLRPETRDPDSPYKVNVEKVTRQDILRLAVHDENGQLLARFEFKGEDISDKQSIHFKAKPTDDGWQLTFIGATPVSVTIGH